MVTSAIVAVLYSLKQTPIQIWNIIKRAITIKLEIHSDQPEYRSFILWVKQFNSQNLRSYLLSSKFGMTEFGESETIPHLNPGTGTHFVWYKKRILLIKKQIETKNTNGVIEVISITSIGIKPTFIIEILNEITDIALQNNKLKIYNIEDNDYWQINYKNKKYINTFIYDKKYEILNIIKDFYNKYDWYITKGIPYKKGLLLSGPPGTGKSTFVSILASELNLNVYYCNLSDKRIVNDLIKHIGKIKTKSIVLLEDIDCLFITKDREINKDTNESLSTLLNVLDGINSSDGVIYILTTNYIDKIDKALIRPGRIDIHMELSNFKYPQIKELFNIFYNPIYFEMFYNYFKYILINGEISPACLQNLFLHYEDVNDLLEIVKTDIKKIQLEYMR
jgi:chaperone BCS1